MHLVAVADPHWRSVLTDGDRVHARPDGRAGRWPGTRSGLVGSAGSTCSALAETPGSRQDLLELAGASSPPHSTGSSSEVGGPSSSGWSRPPASTVALRGDVSAARELRRALGRTVDAEVASWLLRTPPEVK